MEQTNRKKLRYNEYSEDRKQAMKEINEKEIQKKIWRYTK